MRVANATGNARRWPRHNSTPPATWTSPVKVLNQSTKGTTAPISTAPVSALPPDTSVSTASRCPAQAMSAAPPRPVERERAELPTRRSFPDGTRRGASETASTRHQTSRPGSGCPRSTRVNAGWQAGQVSIWRNCAAIRARRRDSGRVDVANASDHRARRRAAMISPTAEHRADLVGKCRKAAACVTPTSRAMSFVGNRSGPILPVTQSPAGLRLRASCK